MTALLLPIKNLVVEWRYEPRLALYSKMDQIGLDFAEDYPDWERTALTLEIRNKKHRRRFFMSYRRSFFDAIISAGSDASTELDQAAKLFERLSNNLEIHTPKRIGIRQWAAFKSEDPFSELVRRATKKFHPTSDSLNQLLRGTIRDIGYVADITTDQGWKYGLRAGPMERDQWFQLVPHEQGLFESPQELTTYREEFCERLFYIDLDCFKEDVPPSDLTSFISVIRSTSRDIISDFYKYYSEA